MVHALGQGKDSYCVVETFEINITKEFRFHRKVTCKRNLFNRLMRTKQERKNLSATNIRQMIGTRAAHGLQNKNPSYGDIHENRTYYYGTCLMNTGNLCGAQTRPRNSKFFSAQRTKLNALISCRKLYLKPRSRTLGVYRSIGFAHENSIRNDLVGGEMTVFLFGQTSNVKSIQSLTSKNREYSARGQINIKNTMFCVSVGKTLRHTWQCHFVALNWIPSTTTNISLKKISPG